MLLPPRGVPVVLAVFGLALPARAREERVPLRELVVERWDQNAGLPANDQLALARMADGYLWLATWEGAVRFDGVRFTRISEATGGAISDEGVLHVEAPTGDTLRLTSRRTVQSLQAGSVRTDVTLTDRCCLKGAAEVGDGSWVLILDSGVVRYRSGALEPRGRITVKGKGEMETWFLVGERGRSEAVAV